tara:strand:- start:6292 stop:6744 length:453 start_codon:yes stop_codon:yes gene_type:complete
MAELTTTITENVILNGSIRGSSNVLTTSDIVDVMERILTCAHSNSTKVAVFATTPHTSPGAIDVENVAYVRVTNLSTTDAIYVAVISGSTSYTVKVRPGGSHILYNGEQVMIGEASTTPSLPATLETLSSIAVKPYGTTDCQVELFVALT